MARASCARRRGGVPHAPPPPRPPRAPPARSLLAGRALSLVNAGAARALALASCGPYAMSYSDACCAVMVPAIEATIECARCALVVSTCMCVGGGITCSRCSALEESREADAAGALARFADAAALLGAPDVVAGLERLSKCAPAGAGRVWECVWGGRGGSPLALARSRRMCTSLGAALPRLSDTDLSPMELEVRRDSSTGGAMGPRLTRPRPRRASHSLRRCRLPWLATPRCSRAAPSSTC